MAITFLEEEPSAQTKRKVTFLEEEAPARLFPAPEPDMVPEPKGKALEQTAAGLEAGIGRAGLAFAKGTVGGVRAFSDVLGANNPISKKLAGVEDYLDSLMSAQSQNNQAEISRLFDEAESKGLKDKVVAGLEAFTVAPEETLAQAGGYMLPNIAAGVLGKAAQLGKLGITAVQVGTGATQAAGTVKGEIYRGVTDYLRDQGTPEDQIEKIATEAQAYGGQNLDQILLGAGLGGVAASTGAERIITRMLTKTGKEVSKKGIGEILKGGIKGGAAEAITEFPQEAQEQVAQNLALQRIGADVPTFKGAVQAGAMGAAAGLVLGGGAGAIEAMTAEEKAEQDINRDAEKEARNLSIPAGDTNAKTVVNEINRTENDINALREVYDEMDPVTPEAQNLAKDIANAQRRLAGMKGQIGEPLAQAEAQQAELATAIAEEPVPATITEPAVVSEEGAQVSEITPAPTISEKPPISEMIGAEPTQPAPAEGVAEPSRSVTIAPEPAAATAVVPEREGPIGNRIKLGRSPQTYVVEEAIPQTEREIELGEQYYNVKNERTGEVQTVEAMDMKPVRAIKMAAGDIRTVRDKVVPVEVEQRIAADQTETRVKKLFNNKLPANLTILDDTTDPDNEFRAAFYPETGEIKINRAFIRNDENIEDIISHELGHFIYGDAEFRNSFESFWNAMTPEQKAYADEIIQSFYNKATGELQTEEKQVRAFMSLVEEANTQSQWRKLLDAIKRWFNRVLKTKFNTADRGALDVLAAGVKRFGSGEKIIRAEVAEAPRKMAAEPRREEGPVQESPEGQSVPVALGNGIDIGPENNMPPNRKIDSHLKNFLFLRGFFESASDRLRRNGFTRMGNAIDGYFDQARARIGMAQKILLNPFQEYEASKDKKRIEDDVQKFFAAQENKRDTDAVRAEMHPTAIKIVNAWQKFGEESGKDNQRVGVKVFEPKKGTWRKIGRVEKFWPRQLKPEYQRALFEPDKYQKEYNEIVEALIEDGKIQKPEEAERYLREYRPEAYRNDYFSGIEMARGMPLPEKLYDYSMQVMTGYVARWAQHTSRIEAFGQKTTEDSKTMWDREMESTRNPMTKDYIQAARDRVEGYFPNDPFLRGTSALNIWATGLQLGNPASAMLNYIGGTTLNAMIGQPGAAASFVESLVELRNLGAQMQDAREKGIISRDLMNIVGDHQAILESNKVAMAGQKVADFLLKWSGFTPVEQMIRTQSFIIGKSFLRNTLNENLKNPKGAFARRSRAWLTRNNFDLDKLVVEEASGPETDRLLRYFANISQGSYTVDQVPIFIDMPIGRFLFKYQKFSTQVMRATWKNTFEPAWKAVTGRDETVQLPNQARQILYRLKLAEAKELGDTRPITLDAIPKKVGKAEARALTLIPAMMWLASAYVGGEVLLRMRDMLFGVLMKGPEYEDMLKELEDDESAAALYMGLERAWYNLIGIGALGLIGNYAQFFLDWSDRERVKNPLDPPALSIIKENVQFLGNVYDQGAITAGDLDDYAKRQISAYRTTQKLAQSTAGWLGMEEIPGVKQEMFRREVASINKYARRWAEEAGIEYRMRRPGDVAATERTPINRKIAGFLQSGESEKAAVFAREYLDGLPKDERKNAIQSITTGARNRQPLRLGSGPMDETERRAFLRWLKESVNEEKYEKILEMDRQYQRDYRRFLGRVPNR